MDPVITGATQATLVTGSRGEVDDMECWSAPLVPSSCSPTRGPNALLTRGSDSDQVDRIRLLCVSPTRCVCPRVVGSSWVIS